MSTIPLCLAVGFLNPLLLWGLPLAAIPIIIHLLNRRRFDRRPWAAMEFLLRALKRNRRRLRMEQWLVLLLRTLAVLLLVLLVSRPQLTGAILGGSVAHHVIVVDDSASMAHRGGADAAMDRAISTALRLVDELVEQRPGDLCTVLLASRRDTPELAAVPVSPGLGARIRDLTDAWRAGDGHLAPDQLLANAAARAAAVEEAGETEFHLITDLRRVDWLDETGALRKGLAEWFGGLEAADAHATVLDVGTDDDANLAVAAIAVRDRLTVAGVPIRFAVEVRNRGSTSQPAGGELALEVDGRGRATRPLPALRAGESATIEFEQTFAEPGAHGLTAAIDADRYTPDDLRGLALDVATASRVLIVDGDPGASDEDAESFFLQLALDPGAEFLSGIELRLVDDRQFAALAPEELAAADLVALCNVSRFAPPVVERLEAFVGSGGGLAVFCGDRIDTAHYDSALYRDGEGLLPARLGPVRGDVDDPDSVHITLEDHPAVTRNLEALRFLLGRMTQIGRSFSIAGELDPAARVVLQVEGPDGPPLWIERGYAGDAAQPGGRVVLFTSTADARWTNLPRLPAFPILMQELHAYAARAHEVTARNLGPEDLWSTPIDPGVHRPDVSVAPLGDPADVTTFALQDAGDGTEVLPVEVPMRQLRGYGLFEVRRERHAGGTDREFLARNPLLDEGLLTPIALGELRRALPEEAQDRVTVVRTAQSGPDSATLRLGDGDRGLWRWLGVVMLAAMLLETILAQRFGRR